MIAETILVGEAARWDASAAAAGARDVYFSAGYHAVYEEADVTAVAFVCRDGAARFFHPTMVRRFEGIGSVVLPNPIHDAETVYGYTGPVANTDDPGFLAAAQASYRAWRARQSIATEFTRFNPLIGNHRFALPESSVVADRSTVVIELRDEDCLLNGYHPKHRSALRTAVQRGLTCERNDSDDAWAAFRRLYAETMEAVGADPFYRLPKRYFDRLRANLSDRVELWIVKAPDGDLIAGGLFLLSDDTIHYHLAGSLRTRRHEGPNHLMIHAVARDGIRRGYRYFHLGGGRTPDPGDSLLRFKKRFSQARLVFHFGMEIVDAHLYRQLGDAWHAAHGGAEPRTLLQFYRHPPLERPNGDPFPESM